MWIIGPIVKVHVDFWAHRKWTPRPTGAKMILKRNGLTLDHWNGLTFEGRTIRPGYPQVFPQIRVIHSDTPGAVNLGPSTVDNLWKVTSY